LNINHENKFQYTPDYEPFGVHDPRPRPKVSTKQNIDH
jgi:hypothetical protein